MTLSTRTKSNRENAQKSTGPRTPYGKSIASQNALKHGILSQRIIIGKESQAYFDAFANDILEDFSPRSQVEREIVERIIYAMWKQRRLRSAETASAELSMRPEIILRALNANTLSDFPDVFKLSDFSATTIDNYEKLQEVLDTLQDLDYEESSEDINNLEQSSPALKSYLETFAKGQKLDYDTIKRTPDRMVDLMEGLEIRLREMLSKDNKAYRALQLKALFEQAHQIPRDTANQYLARYQIQLDNEVYKAMEMLRKHREWSIQFIETPEGVSQINPSCRNAANEDEVEIAK